MTQKFNNAKTKAIPLGWFRLPPFPLLVFSPNFCVHHLFLSKHGM
jgi:hypothetical protein